MEYPFPPNDNAFRAAEWNKERLTEENLVLAREATEELRRWVEQQEQELEEALGVSKQSLSDQTVSISTVVGDLWKVMQETSNLIRCYSELGLLDGETYGLKTLMDSLAYEEGERK